MNEIQIEVPLRITISLGNAASSGDALMVPQVAVTPAPPAMPPAMPPGLERVDIDPDYAEREGYDPEFLGVTVALPQLTDEQRRNAARNSLAAEGSDAAVLPYHHFSLVMNRRRQLAYYTAVNIDGSRSKSPKRSRDRWYFDPRIAESEQIGEDLYARNDLDRGHLVRRLDPAWGDADEALAANNDTFHFTNCSPQHARFNQNNETWQGIENFLLGQAQRERRRLTTFTGPVLTEEDPLYRGVRLPLRFYKVAAFVKEDGSLSVSAYLLDQEQLIADLEGLERFEASTFQVTVDEIMARTGLDFSHLQPLQVEMEPEEGAGLERVEGFPRRPLQRASDARV